MDRRSFRLVVAPLVAVAFGLAVTAFATWPLVSRCAEIPIGGHPRECFSVGDAEFVPPIEPSRVVVDWGPWGPGATLTIFAIATASAYVILLAVASQRLASSDRSRDRRH